MEREEGCGIAVVEATARYKSPARYDDELTIRTQLVGVRGSVIRFSYTVLRGEQILCEGATVHVVVGRDMKRAPLPPRYASVFQQHLATTSA